MLYSLSELRFRLQFNWYAVYPLCVGQEMDSEDNFLTSGKHLARFVKKKLRNCSTTSSFNGKQCHSKRNCIDSCVLQTHLERHSFLPVRSIVTDIEPLNETLFGDADFDRETLAFCERQFPVENCRTEKFSISQGHSLNMMNETFEMYLYFAEVIFFEDPQMTLTELLLNAILSLQAIFIGLNIGKILVWLSVVLQKYQILKSSRIYNAFKFTVCLFGFAFHFFYLISSALNEDLILLEDYRNLRPVFLPDLIFCFKHHAQIDENRQLTSTYLEELTSDLNVSFFQKISVLNETLEEEFLDLTAEAIRTNKRANISLFYFLEDLKCFELEFEDIKNADYMNKLSEMLFVKIKFDEAAIRRYYNSNRFEVYFINQKAETEELNGIDRLEFAYAEESKRTIVVRQQLHVFKYEDRFDVLRNPLSLFYEPINLNDTTSYIQGIAKGFTNMQLNTRTLPLELGSNFVIDDELFDQYFRQIQNVTDYNAPRVIEFEREFYFTSYRVKSARLDDYDLRFHLMPLVSRTKLTNRESYSSMLINILNSLNIWTNFCVLDIHVYIQAMVHLFYRLYLLLVRFDVKLYRMKRSMAI